MKVADVLAPILLLGLSQSQWRSMRRSSPDSDHRIITGGFVQEIISMSIAAFHSKLAVEIPKTNK